MCRVIWCFFFKQKTAYEMRISDWSSDVCSSDLKILTVFGTRPEAIKMAPLALLLARDPRFESRICVTGQHREMLDQVLDLFRIRADLDLNVMKPGQDLTDLA